jgi:hypothetical protein
MEPIEFPEQTIVWAKNQKSYLPLPAYTDATQTITCWKLTWVERFQILFSGKLWLRQLNFSQPLQPQSPTIETPFVIH